MESNSNIGTYLRTDETWQKYQNEPKKNSGECFMCDLDYVVIVKEFNHWVVIENNYPYDTVASTHHLLIPKRHFPFIDNATPDELDELYQLKHQFDKEAFYDCFIENFSVGKSQPQHIHYHLVTWKRR